MIELILENDQRADNKICVFPDEAQTHDLVGFKIIDYEKEISLCSDPINGNAEQFFHLNKFEVGLLIDFLKRLHDNMDISKKLKT